MDRRRGLTVSAPASCRSTHPQSKYVCKGKDRAAFAGGPSLGRKRPRGEGERHGDVAGSISHFEKPHALTALNLHLGYLQCAPEVSSMRQSNTDTHQGVDCSLDAPSTGTDMAEASRNGRWQPQYDFAGRR